MSRRGNKEFTRKTRQSIKDRANGYDELTGEYIGEEGEAHHLLSIHGYNDEYSDVDRNQLRNADNGLYVSRETHNWIHSKEMREEMGIWYRAFAALLKLTQPRLFK